MSQVAKPGSAAGALGGSVRRDAGERPAKDGEFETLLKDKGQAARPAQGAGAPVPSSHAQRGRLEEGTSEATRGEAAWRGLPGELALPAHPSVASFGLGATDGARAAELVARIERIAEQILRAAEVRLGPGGTASARLELDLGGLGQLRVALDRNAEGALAVRFEGASPDAARLLVDHGAELVARLEARGLTLREVTLLSPEGPAMRLGPALQPPTADAVRRGASGQEASRQDAGRGRPEDERRQKQPPTLPEDED